MGNPLYIQGERGQHHPEPEEYRLVELRFHGSYPSERITAASTRTGIAVFWTSRSRLDPSTGWQRAMLHT